PEIRSRITRAAKTVTGSNFAAVARLVACHRFCSAGLTGERNPKPEASALERFRQLQAAAVLDHRLPRQRQPQAEAVFLSCRHERLEQLLANLGRHSRTAVAHVHPREAIL